MGIVSLTTYSNYNSLGNDINIVGTFSSDAASRFPDRHVSAPLLNYVEPYVVGGVDKTMFYTEVNSNVSAGDRVFIINGSYDSDRLLAADKYKRSSDGYRVLFVNNCQVVLDIDYTGALPNMDDQAPTETQADFFKVYYVDSYDTFVSANRQMTTRGGYIGGKFDYYQNNLIFVDYDFPGIRDTWTRTTGITASPGFYVREPAYDPLLLTAFKGETWRNITGDVMSGSFSYASSDANPAAALRHYNNQKMLVMERSFSYQGRRYEAGSVYAFDAARGWVVDVKKPSKFGGAVLTRLNFRDGDFEGSFYSGLYGTRSKKIDWTGKGTWYGGTLLNARWTRGSMLSTISLAESWKATLGRDLKPSQKLNTFNNGGYGFNFILESDFESTSIYGSIVRNARFGLTPSLAVVENFVGGAATQFEHVLTDGLYESCEFNNTSIVGGAVKNSRSRNSLMTRVKHINSWARDVVFSRSTLIADSNIKIVGYDEWTASERRGSTTWGAAYSDGVDFKVYKLYIGEADFLKLKSRDSFYLRGIRVANDPELLNLFDRKFTIGTWTEYLDEFNDTGAPIGNVKEDFFYKKGVSCAAFLATPDENEWIFSSVANDVPENGGYATKGYITDNVAENPNAYHSIDIYVSTLGTDRRGVDSINFNYSTQSVSSLTYLRPKAVGNNVSIEDAYVIDSHIESGIVDSSVWNSGYDIGYNKDLTVTTATNSSEISTYDGVANGDGSITFTTLADSNTEIGDPYSLSPRTDVSTGDILFMSGLDYYSTGKVLGLTVSSGGGGYADSTLPVGLSYSGASASAAGYGLTVNVYTTSGSVSDVEIVTKGLDYKVGDVLYLRLDGQGSLSGGANTDSVLTITAVDTTPAVRLPDSWKVLQYSPPTLIVEPILGKDVVKGLTDSGIFYTDGAYNRWGRFSRTKISNSRLLSGTFRRSVLVGNDIENSSVDPTDRDFRNEDVLKSLVVSEVALANTGNRLSLAVYHNSSIVGGTDEWIDGIAYRSVLNRMAFGRGLVKESTWMGGQFNGGLFYQSRSYDAKPTTGRERYTDGRVISAHKSGSTYQGRANDRYSWRGGEFNGGEFVKSDWEGGEFNDGLFYGSKWYGGIARGGKFGNVSTATSETLFYNGTVEFTTVDNATFVADDTSGLGLTNSIDWRDGIFNGGVFGSRRNYLSQPNTDPVVYNIQLSTSTINNGQTKQYAFTVSGNPSVTQIDLKINLSTSSDVSIYRIALVSPSGKRILVKDYRTGYGFEMKDTFFSSDTTELGIESVPSPYTATIKFCIDPYVDPTGASINAIDYVKSIQELVGNGSTDGAWLVEISSIEASVIDFESEISFYSTQELPYIQNSSVWHNGTFNGGDFANFAYWRDGVFNNGKFTSTAGWEISGSYSVAGPSHSHTWSTGVFNGGEFGNSSKSANSTWFGGEFNGGVFNGRVWNSGIFRNGTFNGTGRTASGGWQVQTAATSSNAIDFVDSYTSSFYGLWRNGLVTDREGASLTPGSNWTKLVPSSVETNKRREVFMQNTLWVDGVFDHSDGTLMNSVWLGGTFSKGNFTESSFNPYVKRLNGLPDFGEGAVWENGTLTDSDFFFSEWRKGEFISGTGFGMWFQDGTAYYMNAHNVTWGGTSSYPTWKNGNWDGSGLDYVGSITNPLHQRILDRTSQRNGILNLSSLQSVSKNRLHVWNIFEDQSAKNTFIIGSYPPNVIETKIAGYTPGDETTIWYPPVVW